MKKFLIILIAFLGISYSANAQTGECRVQNGNGATVLVSVEGWEADGTVYLSINSDCDDYVNVKFELEYDYVSTDNHRIDGATSYDFPATAQPNSSTPKTVKIRNTNKNILVKLVRVTSVTVTGARCE